MALFERLFSSECARFYRQIYWRWRSRFPTSISWLSIKKRNGSRKLIDYSNGKQCLCPVWSDDKSKLKGSLFPITRYMRQGKDRYLFKNKVNCIFNYSLNKYVHLSDTPISENFSKFLEDKEKYLKSDTKWTHFMAV